MNEFTIDFTKEVKSRLDYIWQNIKTLMPDELSELLVELSCLISTIGEKQLEFEQALANLQLQIYQENEGITAKEIEVRTKVTQEYKNYQTLKVLEKSLLETIRSLKKRLQVLMDEKEVAKNL